MNAIQIDNTRTVVTYIIDYYMKTTLGIVLLLAKGKT